MGNQFFSHPLMTDSGTFWRCSHGVCSPGLIGFGSKWCRQCADEIIDTPDEDKIPIEARRALGLPLPPTKAEAELATAQARIAELEAVVDAARGWRKHRFKGW
jgi:hypothetical protein